MKINRSNNNTPIESAEVNTQNQAEQPRPTTAGIASHRDSFETAAQKDNGLFSNVFGGPLIGPVSVGSVDHSLNTKGNSPENYNYPGQSSQMKTNNANDEALDAAEKQRELLEKQKKETTSQEAAILAVVPASVETVGNLISQQKEDQEALKEQESSGRPIRRDDD